MARLFRVHHALASEVGQELELSTEDARHVSKVLRLGVGDVVGVFDGEGSEWRGEIVSAERGAVGVRLGEAITVPVEAPLRIELFQGMCRPERMEWLLAKATEVGVYRIRLLLTERVDAPPATSARMKRWRRIAREACKQCGRRQVPIVDEPIPLREVQPAIGDLSLVLDGGERSEPLGRRLTGEPPRRVRLAVGPESGFAEEELELLTEAGWLRAGLGPRTLRTETAGPVAAAIVLHRWADLGS